jgi:hypothetical protein
MNGFHSFTTQFHANSNHQAKKATPLPDQEQRASNMIWVYFFSRTNSLAGKPGNPTTMLLLQKLHCHPGDFDTGNDPDVTTALIASFDLPQGTLS